MITSDSEKREKTLSRILAILDDRTSEEDCSLIRSFAPVVFAEMPDRIALQLSPECLAERILNHFHFVAREMPPTTQLYRGLPGLHVRVTNPSKEEVAAMGRGDGLPSETTIVETHTTDIPYVFDSLKNYFVKAGLRVFSAVHPIFTVRRQWERVVWMGGPHEEGSREVYCHFQVEPVDSPERQRRLEHEIFSILKCVFLAVEDFPEMLRETAQSVTRLEARPGFAASADPARAFLDWLGADNYIFLGMARYRPGQDGRPERIADSLSGVFKDEALLPTVFPGGVEELESRIFPEQDDYRIIDLDYCNNATAIYHLEPIDGIVFREWGSDGNQREATLLLGRFVRSTLAKRADKIPILREKAEWILRESGAVPNSYVYREILAIFNGLPVTELFYSDRASLKAVIEPIVAMMGDDEISVHCRMGKRYVALSIAFSRLHWSLGTETKIIQALSDTFGPISFHTSADCGAANLLLCYFDSSTLDRSVDPESVRRIASDLLTTWEGRVATELDAAFGEREGRRLFRRYVRPDTRSGLYREVTPPEQVPQDIRHFESLTKRLEVRVLDRTAMSAGLTLYSLRTLGLTSTLKTLQNLGITVTEELRVPILLPDGRKCHMHCFEIEAPPDRIVTLR